MSIKLISTFAFAAILLAACGPTTGTTPTPNASPSASNSPSTGTSTGVSGSVTATLPGKTYNEAQLRSALNCMKASSDQTAKALGTSLEAQFNTAVSAGGATANATATVVANAIISNQARYGLSCLN